MLKVSNEIILFFCALSLLLNLMHFQIENLPSNSIIEENYYYYVPLCGSSVRRDLIYYLSWNLLIMTYNLEKEERKYCSTVKLVHYGFSHNGLSFLMSIGS